MIENDYKPREEFANVRPLGKFGTPNPEEYLRINKDRDDAMKNHPSAQKRVRLDPDEAVNLFRLIVLFLGAIILAVGVGISFTPAIGLIVFGIMLWVMGAWFIGRQPQSPQPTDNK